MTRVSQRPVGGNNEQLILTSDIVPFEDEIEIAVPQGYRESFVCVEFFSDAEGTIQAPSPAGPVGAIGRHTPFSIDQPLTPASIEVSTQSQFTIGSPVSSIALSEEGITGAPFWRAVMTLID